METKNDAVIEANELLGGNGELQPPETPGTPSPDNAPAMVTGDLLGDVPSAPDAVSPVQPAKLETMPENPPAASNPPVCTCGKQPGTRGPHKGGCPVRNSGFRGNGVRLNTQGQSTVTGQGEMESQSQIAIPQNTNTLTDNSGAVALVCFEMATSALQVAFGPEWKPENDEEKNACVTSLAAYFRTKKVEDVPPGLMLCIVLGAYSAKRVAQPNTKTKLIALYLWIKPRVVSVFSRIAGFFKRKTV